jgi:hypothetical protein
MASNHPAAVLEARLAVLLPSAKRAGVEIIVAHAGAFRRASQLQQGYASLHFVRGDDDASTSDLRRRGMRSATGDIVLFVEDSWVLEETAVHDLLSRARRCGQG